MSPTEVTDDLDAVEEHPEEIPGEEPESPYGHKNEKLPEQLVTALKHAVKEFQGQEIYVRRREVLRDRKNRFYERGYQHIYENARTGGFTQGTPGAIINVEGREIQCPNYIDDYNIFDRYLLIIQAILTQNPPGIDFRPINPNLAEDMEAAETAEGYRKMFDRSNKIKDIMTGIVRMMGLSSRTILWTRTEANAQKFGFNEDDSPKQMETATVYGTLESRVPILAKSQEDALYCFLFDDPDVKQAKTEYPGFASKINPNMSGLGESAYERSARLGVLQGTRALAQLGDAFTHLVTRMHCWLRPACFTGEIYDDLFEEDGVGDGEATVKDKLSELFPLGCHAVFVGDIYVGSWAESMDDAIVIGFPYHGDGMYRQAIMDPMVVVQDRFNDNMNAAAEVWDMGWPSTWTNADDQEYDAIGNQRADPYAIRQKKARSGMPLDQEFFREPNPELPATFMGFLEMLEGQLPQFMLATPPAIFGAAMEDQKTASGYAQARSQAMGQQGLIWQVIQDMMARMYYQAALCASKNPDHSEEIVIPAENGQTSTLRLERLTKGKFGAYPDEDSSFPESTQQKRTTLTGLVTMAAQSPIGAQMFTSPDNWKVFTTLMGMPELVIPEAESRDKQVFEIEELLQQSPIPPDPQVVQQLMIQHAAASVIARTNGQPEPPPPNPKALLQPSVPIDELDYHQWEFEKCKEWLSSEARRRQDAEGNQTGVMNVKLHALAHQKAMIAMMPPPMPGPPPMAHAAPKPPLPGPPPAPPAMPAADA